MYTKQQYKDMVEQFCKINKTAKQALNKPVVWESDIFNMTRDELINFVIHDICKNPKSLKYLLNQKNKLNLFFDWCVEKGYISINVLRDEEFDDEAFIFKSIEAMDITVFYDDSVERLIDKLELNKSLYELLIRGFYEGIRTVKDFLLIKNSDINYEEKTIFVAGRNIVMSDKFFAALRDYENCFTYEFYTIGKHYALTKDRKITSQTMKYYNDHIIKIVETAEYKDIETYTNRMISRIATYFDKISETAGFNVSYDMLYMSGFINYVKKICDAEHRPLEYFISLFYIGLNKRGFTRIKEFASEYGFATEGTAAPELRRVCFPYIIKGKYYQQ